MADLKFIAKNKHRVLHMTTDNMEFRIEILLSIFLMCSFEKIQQQQKEIHCQVKRLMYCIGSFTLMFYLIYVLYKIENVL